MIIMCKKYMIYIFSFKLKNATLILMMDLLINIDSIFPYLLLQIIELENWRSIATCFDFLVTKKMSWTIRMDLRA